MIALTSTETLFGGLLAVVALFMLARKFGLSNYWSGVLSGALPFTVYLGYSMVVWQGGDMMAIHLAVFMATAAVLGVFGALRQGSREKMHWAPKAIAVFFGLLVVFNAVLLSISSHGLPDWISGHFLPNPDKQRLHTAFPGVVPHDRNKLYESHMLQIENQRNLGWTVELGGIDHLRSGIPARIDVTIRDAQGAGVMADKVELVVWRMANSGDDEHLVMRPAGDGVYATELRLPHPGRWLIGIDVVRGKDVYAAKHSLFVEEAGQ